MCAEILEISDVNRKKEQVGANAVKNLRGFGEGRLKRVCLNSVWRAGFSPNF